MKILLVNKFHYMKGGSETYYFALADALKKMGHEVCYFALKSDSNLSSEQDSYFINAPDYNGKTSIFTKIDMISKMNYSQEAYEKITELIAVEKPDLAILNLIHRQITLSIIDALYEKNIPIFWVLHDLICVCPRATMMNGKYELCDKCNGGDFFNCVKNKCIKNSFLKSFIAYREAKFIKDKGFYNKVDLFITPSNCHKLIYEKNNFTNKPIIHMTNFLPSNFRFSINDTHENYFLFFARLSRDKGIKTLVNSFEKTKKTLYIVGMGEEYDYYKKYLNDNKIENIVLLGYKSGYELERIIKNAQCVILPSEWYENCPYSIMEAMGYGKPAIVTNIGGLPELIENEINGYVVEPRNENQLSEAVLKICSLDIQTYRNMCKMAYDKAKLLFDYKSYVKKLIFQLKEIKKVI